MSNDPNDANSPKNSRGSLTIFLILFLAVFTLVLCSYLIIFGGSR